MLRFRPLHSPVRLRSAFFSTAFSCRNPTFFSAFPSTPASVILTISMAGRSITDVLMGAARASAEKKGRPPLKHKAKEEAKKLIIAEVPPNDGSVEDKIALLSKKAADFEPRAAAFWKDGEHVPFMFLARALDLISNESGRIAITEILCNAFRTVIVTTPSDLLPMVYLSANKVAPAHEGVELGIGDAAIVKALAEAFGRKEDQVKSQMKALGDLGLVAKASRSTQRLMVKPPSLTCVKVLECFRVIAKASAGINCQDSASLTVGAQQSLNIGVGSQAGAAPSVSQSSVTVVDVQAAKILKQTYFILPIYDRIVPALLDVGVRKLPEVCTFTLGVPIGPMLAKPTKGVSEILDKFQDMKFTCEYKYDGERAQIHYMEDGSVEIYSRNAERNTGKFPDVIDFITSCEGLIIKTLEKDATYEPAKRSHNWLKLKKDYMDSIGDSLDLVPIGAFHGRGKRTGVYGAFLLACYDEDKEEYQSICKIGTGFSEAMLEERSDSLRNKVIPKPKVWEVKAADLSISPVHRAANGVGISLRFPRLLRVREDKNPEQATTSEQVAEMYRAQKINHAGNQGDEDDDFLP